jgi:serine/threonine-protein kinase
MRPELKLNAREKNRFLVEARTAASLQHPFIVSIHEIVEDADEIYLIFEYVDGDTLEDLLEKRGILPVSEISPLLKGICDALAFAHARKVVHRDLKPSNVMVTSRGFAQVMDFGIARQMKDTTSRLTRVDSSGTMAYMAPEQELGKFDARSDIFSLGATIYELVSGDIPFPGPNFLAQKERMTFKPLVDVVSGVPTELAVAVERCLRFDPKERFQTVEEFARESGVR